MPSLEIASELFACVEDTVVILLVMNWPRQAVPKHAFCQRRKSLDRVVLQKRSSVGGIAFGVVVAARCAELVELVFRWTKSVQTQAESALRIGNRIHTTSHRLITRILPLIHCGLEQATRTRANGLPGLWIKKADQEERDIVLPWYPSEAFQIRNRNEIPVAILLVADLQFLEVSAVVHIPAEDNRAEPEAFLCNRQELLLRYELSS